MRRWLRNALQVRPPHSNTPSSSVSLRWHLLWEYIIQVAIRDKQASHRHSRGHVGVVPCSLSVFLLLLLPPLLVLLLWRRRREWHEEVNLPTLELCVGWHHHDLWDPTADAAFGGIRGGGARLLEDVFGVCLHNITGLDGATDFFYSAIGVHYADHVESPTWEDARDAAPYAVSHGFFFPPFFSIGVSRRSK